MTKTTDTAPKEEISPPHELAEKNAQENTPPSQHTETTPPTPQLAVHSYNKPSVWIAGIGMALLIFILGYAAGTAMSHLSMARHIRRDSWQQQEHRHFRNEQQDDSMMPST